jgi:hypothetical protein
MHGVGIKVKVHTWRVAKVFTMYDHAHTEVVRWFGCVCSVYAMA